jgi:general secretion pathway protein A
LRQRIVVRYHLPALDTEETVNYINHRLRVAGGEGRVHFTPEALAAIYAESQGVPRLINALCDRALLVAFIKESKEIDESMIAEEQQEIGGLAVQEQGV